MRKTLAVLAAAAAGVAPAAHAHPAYHYSGGCQLTGTFVGTTWTGAATAAVAATDTAGAPVAVPITVACHAFVNGVYSNAVVVASGTGAASNTNPAVSFSAEPNVDQVNVCALVDVGGDDHYSCKPL